MNSFSNLKNAIASVSVYNELEDEFEQINELSQLTKLVKQIDSFDTFKKAFYDLFKTVRHYKGRTYYPNSCIYKNGRYEIVFKINNIDYKQYFNISNVKSDKNLGLLFDKLMVHDDKQQEKDKLMNLEKSPVHYYRFHFGFFRAILCKYLFNLKMNNPDLNIWSMDLRIFELLKDEKFIILLKKFQNNYESFYNLHS